MPESSPRRLRPWRTRLATPLLVVLLAGCALAGQYSGRGLEPGRADEAAVRARMGEPALAFTEDDGRGQRVLLYPHGPEGYHTFRVTLDTSGRLVGIENVLEPRGFARVRLGDDREAVRRTLGPPREITLFERRHEEVWEWRFCDDFAEAARFYVVFDQPSGRVTRTEQLTEAQITWNHRRVICAR